jgi:transcriptional regulator with XRE-family HTH domain
VAPFPLSGVLRRIRRTADWSQRELAERIGASRATVAAAERGTRDLPVSLLARAAEAAGGRLAVLDTDGAEVVPMAADTVRDRAGRRYPAHLDTRHSDDGWWPGPHRYGRHQPTYTFDQDRDRRDARRRHSGLADDHHRPEPGDSPSERAAQRRNAAAQRRAEERRTRWLAGELPGPPAGPGCCCPDACEYQEDANPDLAHADGCTCRCDPS